jgi:hypothetical protein
MNFHATTILTPAGASPRDTTTVPLAQCELDPIFPCHRCPGCSSGSARGYVACRAPGDCLLFCTPCLPTGFTNCSYFSPSEADPDCQGWQPPHGSFLACKKNGDLYCCPFCGVTAPAEASRMGPDGICYRFCDSCIPTGFTNCK